MRKQSPETQLRYLRREVRRLQAELTVLKRKVHWGSLMANICYNLAQDTKLEERHRKSMDECRKGWDAA